jgi:addiction module RelE/StbE family toxin
LIRWTERAVDDLTGIVAYIGQGTERHAQGVLSEIDERLHLLCQHPEMGKPVVGAEGSLVRELVVEPYRIFYVARPDAVVILAIVRGRQHSPTMFEALGR